MISYYELLGLVKEGEHPKIIEYMTRKYMWDEKGYFDGWSTYFEERITKEREINDLIHTKDIKTLPDYELTKAEKKELEKNLKPFKNEIKSIRKLFVGRDEDRDVLIIKFNQENETLRFKELEIAINEGTYEGLYQGADYTPEELGIWEGE